MSVFKRRSGNGHKWYVYVVLPNGERYRKVVGSKKQAKQVERKIQDEIAEGKWEIRRTEDILFSDLVWEYFEYIEANNAASTLKIRKYRVEAHFLSYFGDMPLGRITSQMIDGYKADRVKEGATPNTIRVG